MLRQPLLWMVLLGTPMFSAAAEPPRAAETPRAQDPRLTVELFARAPDIVHPIGIDFDHKGRLLVIESHTHFRPKNYQGPAHDRIRLLEDTDGGGKANRITTFFEGTTATMDIAVHPDGSVYLATRNEILRLRDTHGTGKADERQRIAFLDTTGNYPHNGLSGLTFDSRGDLFFGMGENIGAPYKLIGSDGTTVRGAGDGGHVFHCSADGRNLRRVATGFWNPFGTCRDIFGTLFAVDNDPDASPPCRLVHVVPGGDYGFQFRYGRSGRHPFQSWDGQLPGTLPMASGTGEAPCEVLSYESDGLPAEYRGQLLVASWADHRVERYELKARGASLAAERKPFVQGGQEFRPVGLAVAPDGSLFLSDWVRRDYNLHGQGAIWHVRLREARKPDRPADLHRALLSPHRPLREASARRLAADDKGREFLRDQLHSQDPRVRATCLTALLDAGDRHLDLDAIADKDPVVFIRAMAVRALAARGGATARFLGASQPASLQLEAIAGIRGKADTQRLLDFLIDADPFLRNAAVQQLAKVPELLDAADGRATHDARQRIGLLLAWRASGRPESAQRLRKFLADPDEDVRFLAAKWIADENLGEFRSLVADALKDRGLNVRMYLAYATALARLDGRDVREKAMADYFVGRLTDGQLAADVRARMLQLVPASHKGLKLDLLSKLLQADAPVLQLETLRALAEHPAPGRFQLLRQVARDRRLGDNLRAQAILGLSDQSESLRDDLLAFARDDSPALSNEALRALVGTKLTPDQLATLTELARRRPQAAPLVARVRGEPFAVDRPLFGALDAWLKRLEGPADAAAGRRVFFHPKLAGCFRCHRAEGRGRDIGPDLSTVGRNSRRQILESILQPSNLVAPYYQVWSIETADGKSRSGMLMGTYLDQYTYVDAKGELFKVHTPEVLETRPLPTSIMPDGLVNQMTDQELRDLLAYLESLR